MSDAPDILMLRAMRRLAASEDGRRLLDHMRERLSCHHDELVRLVDERAVRVTQGRAQELVDLLTEIETADDMIEAVEAAEDSEDFNPEALIGGASETGV